ncbi:MAG: class A beta-lactamase-related serine hydrolase, partial [Candidatus Eremiobacteraeota bacterium]|nr:class A beta-lactamase-related serine hydrolase [Candidatus Eremiobacteraeota bacterium]
MRRILARLATIAITASLVLSYDPVAYAYEVPPPLTHLRGELHRLASRFPAASAVEIVDLSSGLSAGYNAGVSMPAASTIKVPVMVEVFKQLQAGNFDLHRRIELLPRDKDYGSGDLCNDPIGTSYDIAELLSKMID